MSNKVQLGMDRKALKSREILDGSTYINMHSI